MKREYGFYKVKYNHKWIIAEWTLTYNPDFEVDPSWYIPGDKHYFDDDDFQEIGERILMPDEETKTEQP